MKLTVEYALKAYGFIIVSADYQSNHYMVKFDDEARLRMCKEVNFDLSLYEINIGSTFDISIQTAINGYGEIVLILRLADGGCLAVLESEDDDSCKTEVC